MNEQFNLFRCQVAIAIRLAGLEFNGAAELLFEQLVTREFTR
jgi:hypothetical protein